VSPPYYTDIPAVLLMAEGRGSICSVDYLPHIDKERDRDRDIDRDRDRE